MTLEKLNKICADNNIPSDVTIMSDSGWECGPTEMDGVWYNPESRVIVFTQGDPYERTVEYEVNPNYICLYRLYFGN